MHSITLIRQESRRLAYVLESIDPATPVPTCPGWNASDLLWHVVSMQWFWGRVLEEDAVTAEDAERIRAQVPERPDTVEEMLPLRKQVTKALIGPAESLDGDAERWTWSADHTVRFIRNIQAHEAVVHRVDAELAAGERVSGIAPDFASQGVELCLDALWGRIPTWGTFHSGRVVRLSAADTGAHWLVDVGHWTGTDPATGEQRDEPTAVHLRGDAAAAAVPSATVTAGAPQLQLWTWGRPADVVKAGEQAAIDAIDAVVAAGLPA